MRKEVGLWIDHRRAAIVTLIDGEERIEQIESNMEKHIRPAGGARSKSPYGPVDVMKEDARERKFKQHLKRYYEEVLDHIKGADALLLFGPAEAKHEFRRLLEEKSLDDRISGFETVDKMTERQIVAMVRHHFLKEVV
ncbi:MAG TPA: hypothetical protein VK995_01370 [Oceanipulchritudo sp.]|nr:hypothetical protein [Oceanipulchritudo sp.]